jgi:Meiotically up-regulated gene 113
LSRARQPSEKPQKGYVYLIRQVGTNYYKIGITANLNKRLKQLQTGSANQLEIFHSIEVTNRKEVEKVLHLKYKQCQVRRNGEWFKFSGWQVREVVKTMNAYKPQSKQNQDPSWWIAIAFAAIIAIFFSAIFPRPQLQTQPQQPQNILPQSR